jgi:predicted DNA-binding protein (MmcQ/YjbR family)
VAARPESRDAVLAKLRKIVLALPGAHETRSWGHPNFRAGGAIFCAFHDKDRIPCIFFRLDPIMQELFRGDPRFLGSNHTGRDWVDIRADRTVDWTLVRELAHESHARFAVEASKPAKRGVSAKPAAKKRPAARRAGRPR